MTQNRQIPSPRIPLQDTDKKAEKEAEAIQSGDYEAAAKKSAHDRNERLKWHMGIAAIFIFWFVITFIAIMSFSWLWSILAPERWQYLSETQLKQMQTVLTSALVIEVVRSFATKHFLK